MAINLAVIGSCAEQGGAVPPEPGGVVVDFNMTESPYAPPPEAAVDFDMTEGPYAPPEAD